MVCDLVTSVEGPGWSVCGLVLCERTPRPGQQASFWGTCDVSSPSAPLSEGTVCVLGAPGRGGRVQFEGSLGLFAWGS